MKLPWVSRTAYDAVVDERDRLRAQNEGLMDVLIRVRRHEEGMPELPRQPRAAMVPMPAALTDHFNGFWDRSMAKMQRAAAYRRHANGEPWERIMRDVLEPEETPGA